MASVRSNKTPRETTKIEKTTTLPQKTGILSVAAAAMLVLPVITGGDRAAAYDCAHGPDTWRVRGVADWDVLNLRSRPTARSHKVGRLPPYANGVHCLGPCQGNWCRVSWRGQVGWVNMRFLGE